MNTLRLANIRNGLAYPHDDVCAFQSQHAHHCKKCGYFRIDAMPYNAVIQLLKGNTIEIIDATHHNKPLSDALKYGVPTWCLVFNRALRLRHTTVCSWQTRAMTEIANDRRHKPLVQAIRKLIELYGHNGPAVCDENVLLTCHKNVDFDDKPELLKKEIRGRRLTNLP